ncbi:expressed unknown protein [Seminavis robusta]|uniref:Uncharacterized protein n=1 Tax=Seminavis robusta TaxID=568900 RepID=A0A9N8DK44_9STRA|nr:expressed unknown protein [Seminavis robusta]|eukprot:Sro130_g061750.1 n/a (287) ;mRNA; f:4397-5257
MDNIANETGSAGGHRIAGSFFLGLGAYCLLLHFRRARRCQKLQCETSYLPERDPAILRRSGVALIIAMVVAFCWEIPGGNASTNPYFRLLHEASYALFGLIGLASFLESKGLVPLDSNRSCLVMALFQSYMILSTYVASMNNRETHTEVPYRYGMLAKLCLAHSFVCAYSIWNPQNLVAFLTGHVLLIIEGAWLMYLGEYYACRIGVQPSTHLVDFYTYVFLFLFIVCLGMAGIATFNLTPSPEGGTQEETDYSVLVTKEGEREDDDPQLGRELLPSWSRQEAMDV